MIRCRLVFKEAVSFILIAGLFFSAYSLGSGEGQRPDSPRSVESCLSRHNNEFIRLWENGQVKNIQPDLYFLGLLDGADLGLAGKTLIQQGISELQRAATLNDRDRVSVGFWTLGLALTISKIQQGHSFSKKDFPWICSEIATMKIGPLKDEMMILAGLNEALFITGKLKCDIEVRIAAASALYPRAEKVLKKIEEDDSTLCEADKRLALAWLYSVVYNQAVPDWFVEKAWNNVSVSSIACYDDWWRMILSVQLACLVPAEQSRRILSKDKELSRIYKKTPDLCRAWLNLCLDKTLIPVYGKRFDEAMIQDPEYVNKFAYIRFLIVLLSLRISI